MSIISAYTIHATGMRQAQENAAFREELATETTFKFSDEEKEKFVSHMTSGVQLMIKPTEEAILAKTQEVLESQGQLEKVLEEEAARVEAAKAALSEVQQIMIKVPQYRQKVLQIKKEMTNIQRRTSKLSTKSLQLKAARDKILESERQQAARLAKLEARVVTTTPTPGGSGSSGGSKVAVVKE
ncbi:uncharacterized protein LOC134817581 [Bolinopsis microptera]|uniref:uncharacterized protein LOC134817581 n=1 Tax=Bolinopsis microptera TaxID=2820187 RepID=UPI00307AFB2F